MKNDELNTLKYIYCVYESKDRIMHCERYPIIYANKKYIYYKVPGNNNLDYALSRSVHNEPDIQELINMFTRSNIYLKYRYINPNVSKEEIISRIQKAREIYFSNDDVKEAKERLEKARVELANANTEYNTALREYSDLLVCN